MLRYLTLYALVLSTNLLMNTNFDLYVIMNLRREHFLWKSRFIIQTWFFFFYKVEKNYPWTKISVQRVTNSFKSKDRKCNKYQEGIPCSTESDDIAG